MANAMVNVIGQDINGATVLLHLSAFYVGADVPQNVGVGFFDVTVTSTTTPAQLLTEVVSAVQAWATAQGFTVPANHTLVPSYSLQ